MCLDIVPINALADVHVQIHEFIAKHKLPPVFGRPIVGRTIVELRA